MPRIILTLGVLLALESVAAAQSPDDLSIVEFDPGYAVRPTSSVEGPGIKIGEGTVLRPVFGMETGVVSNVFYEETDENAAGLLRLLFQIGTSSLSTERLSASSAEGVEGDGVEVGDFQYKANVRLAYDFLLSGNDTISDTGGLGVGATFKGMVRPKGPWSFGFDENFNRLIRATNFETSTNTNRDINYLQLLLLWHPEGRSIGGYLYYNNTIDIFEEDTQMFANRWEHRVGVHPMWRWLPQTQVFADVSIGTVQPFGDSDASATAPEKIGSYPLRATVGLSTLLNINTTFNVQAGYTNGFYEDGPNFSAPIFNTRLGYRYAPKGRVTVGYDYIHQDSINANFYRDHVAHLHLAQGAGPVVLMIRPEFRYRTYQGVTLVASPDGTTTRNDLIFQAIGGVHYNFRRWIAATLDYRFTLVDSDFEYMSGSVLDDPSYQRHDLLLGLRVAM